MNVKNYLIVFIVLTLPEAKTESEQPTGMVPWKKVDA